jgi:hypothetical protein
MFKPVEVRALPGYRLFVRYSDGVAGEVDLSNLVGQGVFAAWSDPRVFEQVSIGTSGEIRWSDQIDLCPDAIYLQLTGKTPEEVFPSLSGVSANA